MPDSNRLKVLALAPHLNVHDVGEGPRTNRLIRAMCDYADVTALALEADNKTPLQEQLPNAEVVCWKEPDWNCRSRILIGEIKPQVFYFGHLVNRWLKRELTRGRKFDIAHQMLPAAPRYPVALRKFPIPYVVGPLGGALPMPEAFREEAVNESIFKKLRILDPLRFKYDPWLRASYSRADLVLGVAPYMRDVFSDIELKRFEPFLGIGLDEVPAKVERQQLPDKLKLLHVGRCIRNKGLRDTIRALSHLKELPGVHLTSIGDGPDMISCKSEAESLGVADRVRFMGRLPREEIEAYYKTADVFVFPSFRESMGGVLFEAMRWSLPVITTRIGGPGFIVDENCGLQVNVESPNQLALDLAGAIRTLASNRQLRSRLGTAAREKVEKIALWDKKAKTLLSHYNDIVGQTR